jgi:hypothetical protein
MMLFRRRTSPSELSSSVSIGTGIHPPFGIGTGSGMALAPHWDASNLGRPGRRSNLPVPATDRGKGQWGWDRDSSSTLAISHGNPSAKCGEKFVQKDSVALPPEFTTSMIECMRPSPSPRQYCCSPLTPPATFVNPERHHQQMRRNRKKQRGKSYVRNSIHKAQERGSR